MRTEGSCGNWCVIAVPAIGFVAFLVIGISECYSSARLVGGMSRAEGEVVGNAWMAFAERGAAYVPVVVFRTPRGKSVRFQDGVGTYPAEYEVGEKVDVLYDPANPQRARVYTWKRIWLGPTIMLSIGLVPLLVGAVVIWAIRRRPERVSQVA